jgi:Zn ribbon nucleic-acid-binding protein
MARSSTRPSVPLGSLTQRDSRAGTICSVCSSSRTTQLGMNLTDGTPVEFVSCHVCGHRSWTHDGIELETADVLQRTRKVR